MWDSIVCADTPCMDGLKKGAPRRWRLLKAHGTAVGLPTDDDMGNSEVCARWRTCSNVPTTLSLSGRRTQLCQQAFSGPGEGLHRCPNNP